MGMNIKLNVLVRVAQCIFYEALTSSQFWVHYRNRVVLQCPSNPLALRNALAV